MARKLKRGFYWRKGVIWIRTDPIEKCARSTRCHSPAAAEAWRARRQELANRPRYAASLTEKVEDWVKRTIAYKTGERSKGTLHMYRVKLGHVLRIFGAESPIGSITPGTIDAYLARRREEGAKNNTIARELSCLRQMLRLAKRDGVYEPDIAEVMPVGFSAKYKPVTRTLALADVPKLLAALRNDQERAWVCLAISLGADVGDVERATVADYDPIRGVMMVHGTKNISRAAEVPVLEHVRPLFEFALPHLPVSWPRASKGVGEACKRAGLPHLSPKDLRRSAASWLVAAGADQGHVGRFLRHKSDTMVRLVYGQMRPEELGALIAGDVSPALHTLSGPLAEQADAGDLKGPTNTRASGTDGESEGASGPEEDQNGGDGVTPALHGGESPRLRAGLSAAERADVSGIRSDLRYALSHRPGIARCSPAAWSLAYAVARIGGGR